MNTAETSILVLFTFGATIFYVLLACLYRSPRTSENSLQPKFRVQPFQIVSPRNLVNRCKMVHLRDTPALA